MILRILTLYQSAQGNIAEELKFQQTLILIYIDHNLEGSIVLSK
jgi:hypothetical protein